MIKDHQQRQQALDTTQSFIVQAPAGSGKTELLIQRYLALLAQVEHTPEQIIAITFTKKAAQEMHSRVVQALNLAKHQPQPESTHQQQTWQLAKAALARDKKENWQIMQNPNRLCILTIDGFCARIAKQLPILSGFGALPEITDKPSTYYLQAAEQVWLSLSQNAQWSRAIKNLLWHVDNQLPRLQRLLADLLSCREQWLDYVGATHNTEWLAKILQRNLQNLIEDVLQQAQLHFPDECKTILMDLLTYSQYHLQQPHINAFPEAQIDSLEQWRIIAHLLLTNEGHLRKRIDKKLGFPAKSEGKTSEEKSVFEQHKTQMMALLADLEAYPLLIQALQHIQQLPDPHYDPVQQQVVVDLLEVLTLAVAQLSLLFQQHGVSDFNQLLLGALQALGTADQPTDLALALDYKIQHILVDEFQDTSVAQFRLLERLTASWLPDESRTLFLVGDPMQSIYRFRQAEVGLFLAAWQRGIGEIPLIPLKLQVNFRSAHQVVTWVNEHLARAFPDYVDIGIGAVPFTPAEAFHQHATASVQVHLPESEHAQTQQVLALVQEALADETQQHIVILVRNRNLLRTILPALSAAGVVYHAVEIEALASKPVLQDLLILTRTLLNPADRIAWLALLRTPWCYLSLGDLTYLVGDQLSASIWDRLCAIENVLELSEQAQKKLPTFIDFLKQRLAQRQRLPVCQWIMGAWLELGGASFYDAQADNDAQIFFNLLEELESTIYTLSPDELEAQVSRLYATAQTEQSRVQVMTMHKAKGLEFDTVIIPGLHASSRADNKTLLTWWERPRQNGSAEVLIAPLHAVGEKEDKLYNYIWTQQRMAAELEATRLLYVAATRAKNHLHFLGVVEQENATPVSNSLLSKIWKHI
jgi:ATP-dependent helicase/nuclease subunit A